MMATAENEQARARGGSLMRKVIGLTLLAGCAASGRQTMVQHDTGSDEAAILELNERFTDAWSRGDANTLVTFFADDAVRVGVAGDIQRGHDEIRAAFVRLFSGPFAGASVKLDRGTVRFLAPNVALWQGSIEIVPGGDGPHVRGYAVDIMKKIGSTWFILETHPKLFPPPPAQPAR